MKLKLCWVYFRCEKNLVYFLILFWARAFKKSLSNGHVSFVSIPCFHPSCSSYSLSNMIIFNEFWNKLKNRWFHAISSQQLTLLGRSVCVMMKKQFKPSDGSIHRKIRAALALLGSAVRESRQKGSAQIALLAGGRAGEHWCSSTLADTRECVCVLCLKCKREAVSVSSVSMTEALSTGFIWIEYTGQLLTCHCMVPSSEVIFHSLF